ncbi:MAG: hypothetical protein WB615_05935 [Candidatus Tumulicola sp.]
MNKLALRILTTILVAGCSQAGQLANLPSASTQSARPANSNGRFLYVVNSNGNSVSVYSPGGTSPIRTLTGIESPDAITIDGGTGNVFIAEAGGPSFYGEVFEYGPGQTTPKASITEDIANPVALVTGGANDLYVASGRAGDSHIGDYSLTDLTFKRHFGQTHQSLNAIAIGNGSIYGAYDPSVTVFSTKDGKTERTIRRLIKCPMSVAHDSSFDLYVANGDGCGADYVTVYSPTGVFLRKIDAGINNARALAIDGSQNLYVANYTGNDIAVYAPGRSNPTRYISQGISRPDALAFNESGVLFVSNQTSDTITAYQPGASSPIRTIRTGVNGPVALAFSKQ